MAGDMRVQVNLASFTPKLVDAILKTLENVAFTLEAAERCPQIEPRLPDAWLQHKRDHPRDFESLRTDHRRWTLTCGLRDGIELIEPFLIEFRYFCSILTLFDGGHEVMGDEWEAWQKTYLGFWKKFSRSGMAEMIKHLQDTYDPSLFPPFTPHLLAIYKARNCLVHRRGVVADDDFNDGGELVVRWLRHEVFVDGPSGRKPITIGSGVDAAEIANIRRETTTVERRFRAGDLVDLTTQEFSEICSTLAAFARELGSRLEDYAKRLGINSVGDSSLAAPLSTGAYFGRGTA